MLATSDSISVPMRGVRLDEINAMVTSIRPRNVFSARDRHSQAASAALIRADEITTPDAYPYSPKVISMQGVSGDATPAFAPQPHASERPADETAGGGAV